MPGRASAPISVADSAASVRRRVAQVHPDQGRDLVVAANGRRAAVRRAPAPTRSIRPRSSAPCTSSSVVGRAEGARGDLGVQRVQTGDHRRRARHRSAARPRCSARACAREPARSYRAQPPVEVRGPAEREHRLRRAAGEPAAPQASARSRGIGHRFAFQLVCRSQEARSAIARPPEGRA